MKTSRPGLGVSARPSAKHLRALALRFQSALERERTRLAQELHDNLAQKLTIVSLELSLLESGALEKQDPAQWRGKAKELNSIVNDMIQCLRRIKAELRPKVLDEFGLFAALEWQSERFSRQTAIACALKIPAKDVELPTALATELFRMFQSILANIGAHARARRVSVTAKESGAWLHITVSDDGKGITRQQINSPKSMGLLELKERALALGGRLKIEGTAGIGTTVSIQVPVHPLVKN